MNSGWDKEKIISKTKIQIVLNNSSWNTKIKHTHVKESNQTIDVSKRNPKCQHCLESL